jgi:hypothetical protein
MNNAQIVAMLNMAIYQSLPTHENITFKSLIRDLIEFIDGVRLRRYMVIRINQATDYLPEDAMDVENEELDELINEGFGEGEQIWIDHFTSIVEQATEEQLFIMLNILGILNLGPDPDEAMLIAMNLNNNAINNINN